MLLLPLLISLECGYGFLEVIARLLEVKNGDVVSMRWLVLLPGLPTRVPVEHLLGNFAPYHELSQLGLLDLPLFAF